MTGHRFVISVKPILASQIDTYDGVRVIVKFAEASYSSISQSISFSLTVEPCKIEKLLYQPSIKPILYTIGVDQKLSIQPAQARFNPRCNYLSEYKVKANPSTADYLW